MAAIHSDQRERLDADLKCAYQCSVKIIVLLAIQMFITGGSAFVHGWVSVTQSAFTALVLVVLVYIAMCRLNHRLWDALQELG